MFRKILAITALATLAALSAATTKTLIINRVLINAAGGSDDGQGQEMIEIKNTSGSSVNLSGTYFVIIDNEKNRNGQLDGWYAFSGTLAANSTLCIQDLNSSSSQPSITAPNGTNNGSSVGVEFFPSHTGTDLSNSGANYLLVEGLNTAAVTWEGFLDNNGDGVLDSTPWTDVDDAICVYPDKDAYGANAQADYITQLGLPAGHAIVCKKTTADNWTADYLMRMYYIDGSGNKVYDRVLLSDIGSLSSGNIPFDLSIPSGGTVAQFCWDDGTAPGFANFQDSSNVAFSMSAYPACYVAQNQGGNFTGWANFNHVTKGSLHYFH